MITTRSSLPGPLRSAMLASTSAVQHRIGASAFTAASPVIMPTLSDPNTSHSAKNFSLTRALIGAVYTERTPAASANQCAATATSDFPDPVGVASTTLLPVTSSSTASSCAGYSSIPCSATH